MADAYAEDMTDTLVRFGRTERVEPQPRRPSAPDMLAEGWLVTIERARVAGLIDQDAASALAVGLENLIGGEFNAGRLALNPAPAIGPTYS